MSVLADLVARGLVAEDWAAALAPVEADLTRMHEFLHTELGAGRRYLPDDDQILRAFARPLASVRVLILGQDPYPTPGHPVGLAFSVAPDVRPLPGSLRNIVTELVSDLGVPRPSTGDLSRWADAGVLLLNRTLTVAPHAANSHRGAGWEPVTERAIDVLAARGGPLAAILWGNEARKLAPRLAPVPCVESVHPSPLSARNGFFGSRPFSRVNALLVEQGGAPVDWTLP